MKVKSATLLLLSVVLVFTAPAVVTKHFSFQPCQTRSIGGSSAIVPVAKPVADAVQRGRAQQRQKQLTIIGKVTLVASGELITVTPTGGQASIVRLSGLSAPQGTEPGAASAHASLNGLIKDKKVTVKYFLKDKSGLVPGEVWLGKVNVNKSMVVSGLARATDKTYEDDERQARLAKRGIWAEAGK